MTPRRLDAVIFDLDGTLIDSMGIWLEVDAEFLRRRGIDPPDNLFDDLAEGNSFEEVAAYFKSRFALNETVQEIMAEWTQMVAQHYRTSVPLKPGVRPFLERLRVAGVRLGIGTSNNETLARVALEANGVADWFDCLVVGGGELRGKPFPDIFLAAARYLGAQSEHCLVIEDVLVGVQAARSAGMTVLAVRDESAKHEWSAIASEAELLADDFFAIADWVMQRYGV
ncbi:MAG: HAD family phosphatase [Candidatus Cloacimonetes bacterium]|nr:HAD family phosphatase [Candidatus Cloacimonadota bacterium]